VLFPARRKEKGGERHFLSDQQIGEKWRKEIISIWSVRVGEKRKKTPTRGERRKGEELSYRLCERKGQSCSYRPLIDREKLFSHGRGKGGLTSSIFSVFMGKKHVGKTLPEAEGGRGEASPYLEGRKGRESSNPAEECGGKYRKGAKG